MPLKHFIRHGDDLYLESASDASFDFPSRILPLCFAEGPGSEQRSRFKISCIRPTSGDGVPGKILGVKDGEVRKSSHCLTMR